MAGIKLIGSKRVQASSVIEVVISMIVILVVFVMAMMIITNVMRTSLSSKKIQATALLNDLMITAQQDKNIESTTLVIGDFQVKQEVENYHDEAGLIEIHLTAYDSNSQLVAELKKVVINR